MPHRRPSHLARLVPALAILLLAVAGCSTDAAGTAAAPSPPVTAPADTEVFTVIDAAPLTLAELDQLIAAGSVVRADFTAGVGRVVVTDAAGDRYVAHYLVQNTAEMMTSMMSAGVEVGLLEQPAVAAPATEADDNGLGTFLTALAIMIAVGLAGTLIFWLHKRRRTRRERDEDDQAALGGIPATRFSDVAGCDEAIFDLREVVDFLKDPERFTRLGAKAPRGFLLYGPPGTGKTLLARAVAGEAGVPFFATAGSDFVEIYVGSGPKKIRALFAKARKADKAIIFIDEIDAVARTRSAGPGNSSQEHDNTLIALLAEMDGFTASNVVVIGATNRLDSLDPALLRPGRMGSKISVPNPDRRGRHAIIDVHTRNKPLAADVDLGLVAARTPGMSGAELDAIANEAALEGVRRELDEIDAACFDSAIATIAMGRARTSALVTAGDRTITAWHEAGHAVLALVQADSPDPVSVSIIPRGAAGGVTWMSGSDDQFMSRSTARARLAVALGGRAAEEALLDGEFTQGAYSDLTSATRLAADMVHRYGMTRHGLMVRDDDGTKGDDVVEELLNQALETARGALVEHRDLFRAIVAALETHDTISVEAISELAATHLGRTVYVGGDTMPPKLPPKHSPPAASPQPGRRSDPPAGGRPRRSRHRRPVFARLSWRRKPGKAQQST
jgi:cell division protease FtsH